MILFLLVEISLFEMLEFLLKFFELSNDTLVLLSEILVIELEFLVILKSDNKNNNV